MGSSTVKSKTKHWSFFQRARYLIIFNVVPWFIHNYFSFKVNNSKIGNTYPEGQPVIFCSNHQSHLDALIVGAAVAEPYGTRRFVAFMGNGHVMKENFIFDKVRWCGGFPVFRENPKPALKHAVQTLKEGKCVFMSPQGERVGKSPVDDYFNLTKNPRNGVGRIALMMNGKVPIIPMFIHGAGAALSRGKIFPRYKSYISLSFGKPIFLDEYTRNEGWSDEDPGFFTNAKKIANSIMESIFEQMMGQEEALFQIVERKYKTSVKNITEEQRVDRDFRKFLKNLCYYTPQKLQSFIERLTTSK